ncbi:Prolyl 4-hydroxylase subunit alpha-1 [Zostera marina]|uniref:Prolyl 4-hydroxylase subunit alpha-1 n=1 Tax=Zostera marina TaxID=29655 RepID=A0A0K9NVB0_ZOSMR|nr:Prolyl 4-hydroxylase subunit alpha-1 [Zostera marina]
METKIHKISNSGYFQILMLLLKTAMAKGSWLLHLITFLTISMLFGGSLVQLTLLNRIDVNVPHMKIDGEEAILRQGSIKTEVVSWSPRVFVFHNFLSEEECDYLRTIAGPRLVNSSVVNIKTGKPMLSPHRTSTGMFFRKKEWEHPIVERIETRIAAFSHVPKENGEPMQVLRYKEKQYYREHFDYFSNHLNLEKRGGQRIATMLMYLSDNVEGGETYFPAAGNGKCSCAGMTVDGVSVKPIKGDAVLFWSMTLNGSVDRTSFHAGCEVLSGEKWSATKWMRQNTFVSSNSSINHQNRNE